MQVRANKSLPYSTDMAPSDYYLFWNSKSHLRRPRFWDDDELKAATEAWLGYQTDLILTDLIQRHRPLKRKVGQMHWSKRELYWKIMLKPSSNLWLNPKFYKLIELPWHVHKRMNTMPWLKGSKFTLECFSSISVSCNSLFKVDVTSISLRYNLYFSQM